MSSIIAVGALVLAAAGLLVGCGNPASTQSASGSDAVRQPSASPSGETHEATLFGADYAGACSYSPDGSLCAYTASYNGRAALYVQRTDGTGDPQVVRTWKSGGPQYLVGK